MRPHVLSSIVITHSFPLKKFLVSISRRASFCTTDVKSYELNFANKSTNGTILIFEVNIDEKKN